jgi:hypothetical protein
VINSFTRDNERLHTELLKIRYWARGGLTRDEVWQLTPAEREAEVDFLNHRFKEVADQIKKGHHPFF